MSISVSITNITLVNFDVKYTISYYKDYELLYSYNRISVRYSGGVYFPTYADIDTEAYENLDSISSNTCSDYKSTIICDISNHRLVLNNNITLDDERPFGNYTDSIKINDFYSPYCQILSYTKFRHNFVNGYIEETFVNKTMYLFYVDNVLVSHECDLGNDILNTFNCSSSRLSFVMNEDELIENRIETDCCLLAELEPETYVLIT